MIRKILVASAVTALLTLGAAGGATAQAQPPAPQWVPVFYFGTQTFCTKAGLLGQQAGVLPAEAWMCDSGWLMVKRPG